MTILAWGPFFLAALVPGAGVEDHPHDLTRVVGLPLNLFVAGIFCPIAVAGWALCLRRSSGVANGEGISGRSSGGPACLVNTRCSGPGRRIGSRGSKASPAPGRSLNGGPLCLRSRADSAFASHSSWGFF